VANRNFADEHGGVLLLRIDDTDAARASAWSEEAILEELNWLDVRHEEGPVRQSERAGAHRNAAERLLERGRAFEQDGAIRFDDRRRPTLLRSDRTPTYHLATVVDDLELGVTHVIRGKDHLPNTDLHIALAEALGGPMPEYIHLGLVLGPDGRKLSKRHGASTLAELRDAGIPAEAVRAYLDELGVPRGDVQLDLGRIRRLAVEAIATLPDRELAERIDAPLALVPALRGARDLNEARETARFILEPEPAELPEAARPTLERFRELRGLANGGLDADGARALVRELKAVGGDLRALRLALTGRDRGPELWTVILALPQDEALRRIDAAL
jgi:tRNA synthetases class I (E and Q), catalytic domain